jgi:hypothetical protein
MTPDAYLNRSLGSPPALQKRQIYLRDSIAEAFDLEHGHSENERRIL